MKEAGLWQRVRRAVQERFPLARIDRIENGVVEGMPDAQACIAGVEIWLELKYVDKWPVRPSTQVLGRAGLRPEQINWHLRQKRAGGSSVVVMGVGRETWVTSGEHATEINHWTRSDWEARGRPFSEMLQELDQKC
jgi:hypothetical protein